MTDSGSMTNPSEAMIEQVARAMSDAVNAGKSPIVQWDRLHREERELYETAARAAITAMQAATPAAPVQDDDAELANENRQLRRIISELGYCTPDASLEFMALIPAEVRAAKQAAAPVQDDDAEWLVSTVILRCALTTEERKRVHSIAARLTPDRVTPLVDDGEGVGFPLTAATIETVRTLYNDKLTAEQADALIRQMAAMWDCRPGFAAHHMIQDKAADRVTPLVEALEQIAETPNAGWMIARAALRDGGFDDA